METEINLLQTQKTVQKKKSAFFKLCVFLLFMVVLITVAEIAYTFYLRTRLSGLAQDQSATLSQITTLDSKRVKFQTLKERLLAISKILPESVTFNSRINAIFQNIPAGVTVSGLEIGLSSISMRLTSASLAQLDTFLSEGVARITRDNSIGVSKVEAGSIGIDSIPSDYTATVVFYFK